MQHGAIRRIDAVSTCCEPCLGFVRGSAVTQAADIARELGHTEIGPGHLLLGLLANPRGTAYAALRDHGLDSLGPLSLHDVGEDLGMHESTISRVITNKHVQTPYGLFPLELFFPPYRLGSP